MNTEAERFALDALDPDGALAYAYSRLAVDAAHAASDLLAAVNARAALGEPTDTTFCRAAFQAVETLSGLVVHLGTARAEILMSEQPA